MNFPYLDLRNVHAGLACALMLLATSAKSAESSFTGSLAPEERIEVGILKLTPSQATALDGLVSHDMTLARQGGVTGFSSTFIARHTVAERTGAGIDRLSAVERTALDRLVARTIALGPPPDQPFAYSPPARPVPPPDTSKVTVSAPLRAELHGDLSFTVGGGSHGSSFYGTSMDLSLTDPTGMFTVGVGFEQFRSKGLIGLYGPYSPYYPYDPYYGPVGPPYFSPYWGP
jgi:hypothetical protein